MTSLERFKKICNFSLYDDPFIWAVWAWPEAIDRWYAEGMPVSNIDSMREVDLLLRGYKNRTEYLNPRGAIGGMGRYGTDPWIVAIDPKFERTVIREDDTHVTFFEYDGTICQRRKENDDSIPQILEYPVKDRATWEEYKKRLDPNSPGRWLKDWDKMCDEWLSMPLPEELLNQSWEKRDFPLGMNLLSLYGNIRNYMGMMGVSVAIYEQPDLIEEILDHQLWLAEEMLKKVYAAGVTLDYVFIWEDMCYNAGPMVSPQWMRDFLIPRYRKITDVLWKNGCSCIAVDCDGKVDEMFPIWIESGINATWPLERAAGNDARAIRKQYGKDMILMGNIDKRNLAKGKAAIDEEVQLVRDMCKTSGYFVSCDHFIPPDVSWENIKYFIDEVNKIGK